MNIKLGCAVVVLSFFCTEYVCAGALKNTFSKNENAEQIKDADSIKNNNESADNKGSDEKNVAPAVSKEVVPNSDSAEQKKTKVVGDPVVLKIGRKEFKRSQILEDMKLIPQNLINGVPADKLFGMLVDQRMSTYLMVEQAKKAGMDKTKDFIEKIERMKDELLARTFLMKEIAPKTESESVIKARYTKYLVEFKKGKEYHLYHIMLANENDAKDVIKSLEKEDFSKVAKEKSTAPSKEKGGDEGFVPIDMLPPQIKDKLVALKNGEYTKEALKIGENYHVFKVIEIRDTTPQKYEEIKETLKQMVVQEEIMKMIERLEKQYDVKKFNEDGSPVAPKPAS